jgi:hypothetical protein
MGKIQNPAPVKLFLAVTYQPSFNLQDLLIKLEQQFSPIEKKSSAYDFSRFTDYYQVEMGLNLKKIFIVLSALIDPGELSSIKMATNRVEQEHRVDTKRSVNIDPGYISAAKLVLATTKNYSHRLYLGQGIFGDVHMQFSKGTYVSNPWTYPDYKDPLTITFFNQIREDYMQQLAGAGQ